MANGTVIDSLVLELGLDPANFTKGQRAAMDSLRKFQEQAVSGGKEVESQTKRLASLVTNFKREALTGLGLFFGGRGLKEVFDHVTNLDAATGRLSKTIAMDTREVSAWQGAIKAAGGTAEGASSALGGLSGEMTRFTLTGQSGMLGVLSRLGVSLYDQNRNLKTAGALWLDLADAVQGMDPRQAQAFLSMIPGANQEMVNFALLGRKAMENYIESSRAAGVTTDESAEKAREYQKAIQAIDQSATDLGRSLVNLASGPISAAMSKLAQLVQIWNVAPESPEGKAITEGGRAETVKRFGSPRRLFEALAESPITSWSGEDSRKWLAIAERLYGPRGADEATAAADAARAQAAADVARRAAPRPGAGASAPGYGGVPISEVEDYVRRSAERRGIDPNVALAVARREGLYNFKSTVPGEESYGPFQLYYGNKGGGGLGPEFDRRYGASGRDPATWKAQVDFSLDKVAAGGWGPFHGARGVPGTGIGAGMAPGAAGPGAAGPTSSTSISTTIGSVQVNAPQARDADGIAREIAPALERNLFAGAANGGQQ